MISIAGIELDVIERGQGAPILYLHGGAGVGRDTPFIDLLAKGRRVIAPSQLSPTIRTPCSRQNRHSGA